MKKFLIIFSIFFGFILITILGCFIYYFAVTNGEKLDKNKLVNLDKTITFYDSFGNELAEESSGISVTNFKDIPPHLITAFISIEDKRFYTHKGVDYKGIFRAIFNNAKSFSAKEGASTIEQQLIKNTHLTNKKTINRKLVEIKLAKELEKNFSKNEIMEKYLNTIYFGNGCYGITSASKYYFNKKPSDLSINESAVLSAIIKAPNTYAPNKNIEKCDKRKNLVLSEMFSQNYITKEQFENAKNQSSADILTKSNTQKFNFLNMVKEETLSKLGENGYFSTNIKVNTTLNKDFQENLEKIIEETKDKFDVSAIILNKDGQVLSYYSTCGEKNRQMGSVIKPLIVYAPAIEKNVIYSCTKIDDTKSDFNGYSPSNYNEKYLGKITAKTALINSSNVCAVKVLSMTGIEESIDFVKKTDIKFDENDKNLSLALGSSYGGATLKEITSAYLPFMNNGIFQSATCINDFINNSNAKKIEFNNKSSTIFSPSTCEIINDMLLETVKSGTARKLNHLGFPLCAKTGTVGSEKGNTDAYCISYNSEYVVGVWFGNKDDLMPNSITGGSEPTKLSAKIWENIYKDKTAPQMPKNTNTVELGIDKISFDKDGTVELASENTPKRFIRKEIFKKDYYPRNISNRFLIPKYESVELSVKNNKIHISLCLTEYTNARIYKENNGQITLVFDSLKNKDKLKFIDKDVERNKEYSYYIIPYYSFDNKEILGEQSLIGKVKLQKIQDITEDESWWDKDYI